MISTNFPPYKSRFLKALLVVSGVLMALGMIFFARLDTSSAILKADIKALNISPSTYNEPLTNLFLAITFLGNWQTIVILAILIVIFLWLLKKDIVIAPLCFSVIGSAGFNMISKLIFQRPRPDIAFYIEKTFSFPSGHSTIAVSFYGIIAYCLFRRTKNTSQKIIILLTGISLILLIGLSRLYLGVHFLSDVIVGYLIGLTWLALAIIILERLLNKKIVRNRWYANPIDLNNILDIFKPSRLSKHTQRIIGGQGEPLSFIITAPNDQSFIDTFKKAKWHLADKVGFFSTLKTAKAVLLNQNYQHAPMTPCFWNNKVNNFNFEKSTELNTTRQRHHCRFWTVPITTSHNKKIYVGIASFDIGLKWLGLIHRIESKIDKERETLFSDLRHVMPKMEFKKIKFVGQTTGRNNFGDKFTTDGKVYIIDLN